MKMMMSAMRSHGSAWKKSNQPRKPKLGANHAPDSRIMKIKRLAIYISDKRTIAHPTRAKVENSKKCQRGRIFTFPFAMASMTPLFNELSSILHIFFCPDDFFEKRP